MHTVFFEDFFCYTRTASSLFITYKNCIHQILNKKWEYNEAMHQLFIDFKKAYDSVRWEVLYSIVIEFGVPMKLVRLMKVCLNKTYCRVRVGKHLSDLLLLGMVWNKDILYHNCFTTLPVEDTSRRIQVN
jgi:Reverse transcriptase (RNA-dependent DNA polymerase).